MARYRWDGGQPHIDEDGRVFRPLEVYEFDSDPPFGPFTLVPDEPTDAPEPPAPPPTPAAVPGGPARPAAATTSPAGLPATGTEGA